LRYEWNYEGRFVTSALLSGTFLNADRQNLSKLHHQGLILLMFIADEGLMLLLIYSLFLTTITAGYNNLTFFIQRTVFSKKCYEKNSNQPILSKVRGCYKKMV